jgi:hypothetical protein
MCCQGGEKTGNGHLNNTPFWMPVILLDGGGSLHFSKIQYSNSSGFLI